MEKINIIQQHASYLRLSYLHKHLQEMIHQAQIDNPGYMEFVSMMLGKEVELRQQKEYERRVKVANLPRFNDLERYDYKAPNSIPKAQLMQLRELLWIDQVYNLVLMGPSGRGKTYIAAGLVNDAIQKGYKAYFTTMSDLVRMLSIMEVAKSASSQYKRYLKAHLIAIDDMMMFPMKKHEAVALFNFVNCLHEQCSLIITTNKSPTEWVEVLDDEVLATALLDRILFHCEVVKLEGPSYRMDNRKTIFMAE